MRHYILTLAGLCVAVMLRAQTISMNRVTVHDPSVVWEPSTSSYYIFGSHRAWAKTTNFRDWQYVSVTWGNATSTNTGYANAFSTNLTKSVKIGGVSRTFGNFDVKAWSAAYGNYDISGNMWAPDVIWNKKMQKWCMYMSINGPQWNSSIVLLTADRITGPYYYQGPVVYSGFNVTSTSAVSYKNTDLELVIGTQSSLPARYNVGNRWGSYWPHCIDPCVFYDEQGKLWMTYGSWSGGIYILRLNEDNGLRDYDVSYPVTASGTNITSDPYFGKKIAGGAYVSGEASYVEHIGNYYYLFVTYGGLEAAAGYQMRVFRSENPDGPYADPYHSGGVAMFDTYRMNYGPTANTVRGENIFGAYGDWGYTATGINSERSQGHNSIIAAEDGRTYMVYHTRFQDRGEEHEVRVHQVFLNRDGWLCAAPFEYTGETVTDDDIASRQLFSNDDIAGYYRLLIHRFGLDHANKELATPVDIRLGKDGIVSGGASGTWRTINGTSYITLTLGGTTYEGVVVEQMMERTTEKVIAFTCMAKATGVTAWGYQVAKELAADGDMLTGVCAYYDFDELPLTNRLNTAQTGTLQREGSNTLPVLQTDATRSGKVVHTYFGASGNTSNVKFPNPLYGRTLAEGMTIAFWTNVADVNLWDALFSFYNPTSTERVYMTPNTYIGYNDMVGNWIDLNHGDAVTTGNISFNTWNHVVLTLSRTGGFTIYLNGEKRTLQTCNGEQNHVAITTPAAFDYGVIADHMHNATDLYLGYGSFWGSLNASYDELLVYDRVLTAADVQTLYQHELYEKFATDVAPIHAGRSVPETYYTIDGRRLSGRPVQSGIYIHDGCKVIIR